VNYPIFFLIRSGLMTIRQATSLLAGWSEVIDTHMLSKGVKEKNVCLCVSFTEPSSSLVH
jgi:hypothetical protein